MYRVGHAPKDCLCETFKFNLWYFHHRQGNPEAEEHSCLPSSSQCWCIHDMPIDISPQHVN
jgi:hypothetical protein